MTFSEKPPGLEIDEHISTSAASQYRTGVNPETTESKQQHAKTRKDPTDNEADTSGLRAKGPSTRRPPATSRNRPVQMSFLTHFSKRLGQITMEGVAFEKVDITLDGEARDYVMSLGYLQAPVVVAGDEHWSGFRPDRIKALIKAAAAASDAAALPA